MSHDLVEPLGPLPFPFPPFLALTAPGTARRATAAMETASSGVTARRAGLMWRFFCWLIFLHSIDCFLFVDGRSARLARRFTVLGSLVPVRRIHLRRCGHV